MPLLLWGRDKNRAEKFLANADRGLDSSTLSRDVIDLAHMIEGWSQADAAAGIMIARGAYGHDVDHKLALVAQKLRDDKRYRSQCIDGLMIANPRY